MAEPFLALITPLTGGGGVPTHPIAPGGPPPGIWPAPGFPAHPIAPGGPPPSVWPSPGHPAHPIAPGGPPPGIWGGGNVPMPTPPIFIPGIPGGPGEPPGIWVPVYPTPPIAMPDPGEPTHPIEPGQPGPHPEHPIAPGGPIPPVDPGYGYPEKVAIVIWIPGHGFKWVVIDTSARPDHSLPGPQPHPEHPIAPGGPEPSPQ